MNEDQLAEAIARAIEAAKPAAEYCLLPQNWWALCMTKAEWAGWMQALGALVAIIASAVLVSYQLQRTESARHAAAFRKVLNFGMGLENVLKELRAIDTSRKLSPDGLRIPRLLLEEWVSDARTIAYEDLSLEWMVALHKMRATAISCSQYVNQAQEEITSARTSISPDWQRPIVANLLRRLEACKQDLDNQMRVLNTTNSRPSRILRAGPSIPHKAT